MLSQRETKVSKKFLLRSTIHSKDTTGIESSVALDSIRIARAQPYCPTTLVPSTEALLALKALKEE